jgi:nucleotide-binding universal stress UspA family protein
VKKRVDGFYEGAPTSRCVYVLYGLGPGQSAAAALETALDRAAAAGDEVTVAVYGDSEEREHLRDLARDRLADADVPGTVRDLEDDPGGQLVALAEQEGFDRIVLPGGERSPLGKIRLDSLTEFVLLNATTTVTLIR